MSGTFRENSKTSDNFLFRGDTDVSIKKDKALMFTSQEDRSKSSMSDFSLRIDSPEPTMMPRADPIVLPSSEPAHVPAQVPMITTSQASDQTIDEPESNYVSTLQPVHVSRLLKQYPKGGMSGPPPAYSESNASAPKQRSRYERSLSSNSFTAKRPVSKERSFSEERGRSTSSLSSHSFNVKPSGVTRELSSGSFNSVQHDSRPHSAVSDHESPLPPVGQSILNSDYLDIPK